MMERPALTGQRVERIDIMNSASAEEGIESELIDLDGVPFTKLREFSSEVLKRSMRCVVERAWRIQAPYRSNSGGTGERID